MIKSDPPADTSNEVSWQSAFWALLPIALNSMTQPTGKVLGTPSKYSFYFNSSPIICLANALEIIVSKLCWRAWTLESLDAAASLTAKELFEDVKSQERPSGLVQLQEIKVVRLTVFVLGAIPQIIKLYAMSGVVGTQLCASMYLGSFLFIEATMRWLDGYRTDTRGQNDLAEYACDSANILEVFILSFSQSTAILLILTTGPSVPLYLILWIFPLGLGMVFLISVLVYKGVLRLLPFSRPSEGLKVLGLLLLEEIVIMLLIVPTLYGLFGDDYPIGPALIYPCVIALWFMRRAVHYSTDGLFQMTSSFALVFMSLQLLAGIQWYTHIYDSNGTYKPAWTNQLG